MAAIDQLAKYGPALSVLLRMSRQEVMSMREFELASKLQPKKARKLRDTMHELGLIDMSVRATQGAVDLWKITPTPLGRNLIKRILEMNELLEVARQGPPDFDDDT